MAQMFLSESSRRTQQIPDAEMEDRWAAAFGEKKRQACSTCGGLVHETKNGICAKCQADASTIKIESHTCVKCGNMVLRVNDLGLCYTCNLFQRNEEEEAGRYNGQ